MVRFFDRKMSIAAGVAAGLALVSLLLHSRAVPSRAPIVVPLSADALAERRVEEQFRTNAAAAAPSADEITLAGSGAPGLRDGVGLHAQFRDPVDISLSPDGRRLLVLDDGGRTLRQIDTETRAVATLVDWHGADSHMFLLERAVATEDGMFLLSVSPHTLYLSRHGTSRILAPAADGPADVADLVYRDGVLYVLDGRAGRAFKQIDGGESQWRLVATFDAGAYDRLAVDGGQLVAVSSVTGEWSRVDVKTGERRGRFRGAPGVLQATVDPGHERYLALSKSGFSMVPRGAFDTLTPLPLWSVEGRRVGIETAPDGYRTSWFTGVVRTAFDARRNTLYAVNRSANRVTMALSSFVSWKYGDRDPSPRRSMSADYPSLKPAGSTRILWLSHSVYWFPAGEEAFNLALGGPRQLEVLLNSTDSQAGRWEVVNPALTGQDFYSDLFPRARAALQTHGFDYALVIVDLEALYWTLRLNGFTVPVTFDADGLPIGIDAELARQPVLERTYGKPIRPLVDYMKAHMQGPAAAIPLLTDKGEVAPSQFLRAWTEDARFRSLLLDLYVQLLAGVNKACAAAGVKLAVLVAPTSNFIAPTEWVDAYVPIGANERPYDFESVHRPILQRLWASGIPTYDLTYDMLARHPRYFPFGAPSHHRSGLFHRALAESIVAVAHRFNVFSFAPSAARAPRGTASPGAAAPAGVVVTERGDTCFVLHDIWDSAKKTSTASRFPDLLALAVADAARSAAARTTGCADYSVSFVYIKNRDDYGNRDFRGIESVASMRFPAARLEELGRAARDRLENDQLRAGVQFATR